MSKVTSHRFPRRSQTQWQQLIRQYEESDLPIEKFCERNNISQKSLAKWRYRLKHKEKPVEFVEMTPNEAMPRQPNKKDWAVELSIGEHLILRIGHLR